MSFQVITPKEAYQKMQEGSVYLDVRTPEEFSAGHAKGAINIPIFIKLPDGGRQFNPNFLAEVKRQFPSQTKLVIGCHSGGRSGKACELLDKEGYLTLCNINGGFGGNPNQKGWKDEGLPVTT